VSALQFACATSQDQRDLLFDTMQCADSTKAKNSMLSDQDLTTRDKQNREMFVGNLKRSQAEAERRFAGELRPGAVVIYTGKALRAMGERQGALPQARFVIVACSCDLCQLGRHVCVERPNGRHIARAALRVEAAGENYLDEPTPDQSGADDAVLSKGLQMGFKKNSKISTDRPTSKHKRWQDCRSFVRALEARKYLVDGRPVMADGIYWYLYELWQDGTRAGALAYKKYVAQHSKAKGASSHREGRARDDVA
jgi:hypothetical protein